MRAISLFSGAGGLDLGLERAGIETIAQVEIDPWCRQVLQRHWPGVPKHGDIRTYRGEQADIIHGGFPCTDISAAADRWGARGLAGERSGLWAEFARVLSVSRPVFAVIENTGRLRNGRNGQDLRTVVGQLDELGYLGVGILLDAAAFGLPARRPRVFLLATDSRRPGGVQRWQRLVDAVVWYDPGRVILEGAGQPRPEDYGSSRPSSTSYRKLTPVECERLMGWPDDWTRYDRHGCEIANTHRYKMCGNGVAVPVAEWVGNVLHNV